MRNNEKFVTSSYDSQIKFERRYSVLLSDEEYSTYRTRDPKKIENDFKQLIYDFENESKENQNKIIIYQKYSKYKLYLHTRYWCICRNKKLLIDGFSCKLFKEHPNDVLCVHHYSYEHRGNDAYHLDCLMTLCFDCHEVHEANEKQRKENKNFSFKPSYNYQPPNKLEEFEKKANALSKAGLVKQKKNNGKKIKKVKSVKIKRKNAKIIKTGKTGAPLTQAVINSAYEIMTKMFY